MGKEVSAFLYGKFPHFPHYFPHFPYNSVVLSAVSGGCFSPQSMTLAEKMPLYRNAHSPENFSDEWAFFFPCIKFDFAVTQTAIKSWIKNHYFSFVPE